MKKNARIFIVHGWDGYPEEGWFPWLKKELEAKGFKVLVTQFPGADNPRIEKWVPKLAEVVGTVDESTYFIGHSVGCQTIVRYLELLPENIKVGDEIYYAGWLPVVRVNQKTVTVSNWLGVATLTYKIEYRRITKFRTPGNI